jgi:hypothetical protein
LHKLSESRQNAEENLSLCHSLAEPVAVEDLIVSTTTKHKDLGFRPKICSKAAAILELLRHRKNCHACCSDLHHSLLGQWSIHYQRKFSFAAFTIVVGLLIR